MRIPLIGGAYSARSIIANSQKCINYFPETNTRDAPCPVTHYQRPGLNPLVQGPHAPVRGIWRASNWNGYCVIGANFYQISSAFRLTQLGILGGGSNACTFVDNGLTGLVSNGVGGSTVDLSTGAFAPVVDPSGIFVGASRLDYIDTFILFNIPGTNQFGSTLSNKITFDPLYVAAKTDWPDPLQCLIVNRHEILLIGQLKSEIWYDAGNANFPFAELPGSFIEHGTCAPQSVASFDIKVLWLGQDLSGDGIVWMHEGYNTKRVSNFALEFAIRRIKQGSTINDALGWTYQQDGHAFYVLTFPTGDQTWVLDLSTMEWHQRAWTDPSSGILHRDRANCAANIFGKNVVGDWENGTLYELDLNSYSDTVAGVSGPITCIRTFPHLTQIQGTQGLVDASGRRIRFKSFTADIESGMSAGVLGNSPAEISLRWSSDRGRTFGQTVLQSNGQLGEYLTQPIWRSEGVARDMVFEISHSLAGPAALNGAWVEAEVLAS